jgi:hypothetical protein
MTVDVGLTSGAALWKKKVGAGRPFITFCLAAPRRGTITQRAWHVADGLAQAAVTYDVSRAFLEQPQYMDSASGQRSARRGDLFKLIYTTGVIAGALLARLIEVHTIKISEWKGQLPKNVVDERIARALKVTVRELKRMYVTSHERDAVGMGLALAKRLHIGES